MTVRGYRVAIIDDAEDQREVLYYLLRDRYEILNCGSVEDALAQFRLQRPDVILLDLWLKETHGMEALRIIRAEAGLQQIPVIAVTATVMDGDRQRYLAAGFNDYISKPLLDVELLFHSIQRCLP